MRWLAIGAVLTLMGCSSAGSDAEKRYDIVSRGDDENAKCSAARDVAAGYLKDENEPKYRDWKLRADVYCQTATLHE